MVMVCDTVSPNCSDISIILHLPSESDNAFPHKRLHSPTKSNTSVASFCRICHEGESSDSLISPCQCSGTVALIHKKCLEKWLSTSNTEQCEICQYDFHTQRDSRTFREWLDSDGNILGPNGLYGDILCILFLTPLCLGSVYMCSAGAYSYFTKGFWEGIGLALISLTVLFAYVTWVYMTSLFHYKCLKAWRNTNPVIRLSPSSPRLVA